MLWEFWVICLRVYHSSPHHILAHHNCSSPPGCSSWCGQCSTKKPNHNLKLARKLSPSEGNFSHVLVQVRMVGNCNTNTKLKQERLTHTLTHTSQPGWLIMPIGPSLIYLVCSGACACQHGVCMQSWSSHSSRQREDLGNSAEDRKSERGATKEVIYIS